VRGRIFSGKILTYLVNSGDQLYQILCNKVNGTKQRV